MNLPRCVAFAAVALAAAVSSLQIFVDAASTMCTVLKRTELSQLHRGIKSPTDVLEQSVSRQNRVNKAELLLLADESDAQKIIQIFGGSASAVDARILALCPNGVRVNAPKASLRGPEEDTVEATSVIKKIVDSGDPSNRIDVVFMGDGYTASEQTRFFDDIQRLTNDMFTGDTFAQYLPLFNIWAAYLPGANSARSPRTITWKHWLTEPNNLIEQKSAQLYQKHIWYDLKQGAYTISFTSTGEYSRWYIQFSASGVDTDDSLTLCNAVVYEYKAENEFKLDDPDYIGIYPTYDINKDDTYRPNNEKCIMRNMTSTSFCSVCKENMWLKFMERIEFIDGVVVAGKTVEVQLIPLGQLRLATDNFIKTNPTLAAAERYTIQWLKGGVEATQFRDQTKVDLTGQATGQWTVRVTFATPTVRLDTNKYMQSEKTFTLA
ncbi:hypothetical protein PybrP1_012100 [[Pythium] brassicae (nom. inval.)]|nr:hypothetical protein PybrP1_012100 [[Pythium] brassicae (nom. inval.)]